MARKTEDGKWAFVPLADGFDFPVGKPDAEGYYKSRGLRLRTPRHMGEDWNGVGGGNSDLGDPVYTVGHGLVTYASDARGRWGKVVIVRHAFRDPSSGKVLCCQTLYAHLDRIDVQLGQLVRRGDQIEIRRTGAVKQIADAAADQHRRETRLLNRRRDLPRRRKFRRRDKRNVPNRFRHRHLHFTEQQRTISGCVARR